MGRYQELLAYKKAYSLAMEVFEITKTFPKTETYSLIDQFRRSSRAVCTCLAEAYRKRRYPAHFISKITDSDMENAETEVWTNFSFSCNYITQADYNNLITKNDEVGRLLGNMLKFPEKYL